MAQNHARLAELVAELGGDEVRFLFRDLVQKALQDLIDAELTEAIGAGPHERRRRGPITAIAWTGRNSRRGPSGP